MENFIVSARKYRPVTFDTVVGQPGITHTLKNAIRNNHLAQAFLFTGPRGVGKTTTARILAKTINCERITENIEACNTCDCCVAFNSGHSLNIYELDAASNNSVEDIRALVEQVRYPPQVGKYKVYIIDEVHMLSANAFNAFLKTLEEPPSYAIFILATTEKHKIIPTILSRCQIFDFNRIGVEDIASHLLLIAQKENINAEEDALHVIAQKADGALRDALSLFDQLVSFSGNTLTYKDVIENLNILDYDYYFRITDDLLAGNIPNSLLSFNEILNNGFDAHNFINGLASHFRDLLVCKDEITLSLLEVSPSVRERYKVQSKFCNATWLMQLLEIANKADMEYKSAKNQRLHVELSLLRMCTLATTSHTTVSLNETSKKKIDVVLPVKNSDSVPASAQPAASFKPSPEEIPGGIPVTQQKVIPPAALPDKEKNSQPNISTRKTISITGKLNSDSEKKAATNVKEVVPDLANPFQKQDLDRVWFSFADALHSQGRKTLETALKKRAPELKENYQVYFTVDNVALEKDLNEQKSELLGFIRKQLSNYKIFLHISVQANESETEVPYTPSEKFKRLAEKNPLINELRKKFDLEIEY